MQINSIESTIKYLEEHEYFLDQLMNNKESIYQEKISNIQDSMEEFLQHPNNDLLREELKQEYIHMLKDILDDIEEQKIEEQKINNDPTTVKLNEAIFAVGGHVAPIPDRPKTRKELREERIRQEKLLSEARKEPEKEGIVLYLLYSNILIHTKFSQTC